MTTVEPKRNFLQSAVHNLFAVVLGVTPPAPGQELFYAGLLLGITVVIAIGGYFAVRLLMNMMMG
jgi:hypothetical protein